VSTGSTHGAVDLYWLPLGEGGQCVRWSGKAFELMAARYSHRTPRPLFHSALEVFLGDERFVIEMAPVWSVDEVGRGSYARARWESLPLAGRGCFATRFVVGPTAPFRMPRKQLEVRTG